MRTRRRDWGLTARMGVALLLLGVLYVGIGYAVALLFGFFVGPTGTGHAAGIAVAVVALAGAQYHYGPEIALRAMGAEVVGDDEYPALHDTVSRLARQADVATPRVAVAENPTPNAFATGRRGGDAVVCVTTGLLDALDGEEREAVLAHEMAHVMHRDFLLMTVVAALSATAGWIVRWGFLFGDGGGEGAENPHVWVGYAAALGVWIGAFLVGRVLSRYREYAADRGAAALTGDPAALASALLTIDGRLDDVPEEDLRDAEPVNALLAVEVTDSRLARWFRTHPDVEDRVERLRELERSGEF